MEDIKEETITDTEPSEESEEPKEEPTKEQPKEGTIAIPLTMAFIFGICAALMFVNLAILPGMITEETLNETLYNQSVLLNETVLNESILAYQYGLNDGMVNVANYTTTSGNFTFIYDNKINTQSIISYCNMLIQNKEAAA